GFAHDTTHTKVAKIRAKWTRMNKRNTFWPCIISQNGEPKPCSTQFSMRGNSFSAVQIARYRGRDTQIGTKWVTGNANTTLPDMKLFYQRYGRFRAYEVIAVSCFLVYIGAHA